MTTYDLNKVVNDRVYVETRPVHLDWQSFPKNMIPPRGSLLDESFTPTQGLVAFSR